MGVSPLKNTGKLITDPKEQAQLLNNQFCSVFSPRDTVTAEEFKLRCPTKPGLPEYLQKAFDTVNHKIMLQKLEAIGLHESAIAWFKSYLYGRQRSVEIGEAISNPMTVTCGVPQGSILGPLLFLIYINDIYTAVRCKLLLYADGSALLVSGKDTKLIQESLSSELEVARDWLINNKLSLHLGKTESILFGSKRKLNTCSSIQVRCAGTTLASQTHVKYLGIDLDQSLTGERVADKIICKSNAKLKLLYRHTKNINMKTKKTSYHSINTMPF